MSKTRGPLRNVLDIQTNVLGMSVVLKVQNVLYLETDVQAEIQRKFMEIWRKFVGKSKIHRPSFDPNISI